MLFTHDCQIGMKLDAVEAGLTKQRTDAIPGVEPLGVKLVVDDPGCVVDDQFAGNDAIAIRGQFALPADQVLIVDPFPASPIQVCAEPASVHDIKRHRPAGDERAPYRFEQDAVVRNIVEIAERIAHEVDAIELPAFGQAFPRIALAKRDRQRRRSRPLPGELNEKARMIETGDVVEPTPGKLKRVAALAAAQVQDSVAMRKGRRRDQDVDLLGSEPVILDDVAVGAQVERAKQRTPPIGRDMAGEVAERTGRADVPFNHLGYVSGSCRGKRFDFRPVDTARPASRRQSAASLSAMRAHRDAEWFRYVS